jgi:hypothetical protein
LKAAYSLIYNPAAAGFYPALKSGKHLMRDPVKTIIEFRSGKYSRRFLLMPTFLLYFS